uniref:Uncharacterized protein n=1 Tax=Acrobeloides nanus TaxID=290746 RepID=A0A914CR33_9BILA
MQFILGMNCGGFYKCATLISKQYSHFVISIIQFMKCLVLLAAPGLMSIFVVDDTSREQWKNVFFVLGIFLIISNLLFCFLVNDKPASFTKITKHKESYIQVPQESDKNGI